jgi:indoleamine 2,3-dioxygenase
MMQDFNFYRLPQHQDWLNFVRLSASKNKVRDYSLADPLTALRYLENLEQIADFRDRHWRFAKDYILKQNLALVGTGGAPIR